MSELTSILREWLATTIAQELDQRETRRPSQEDLGQMLGQEGEGGTKKVRARRFREAMAGLETLLVGEREIEYRMVLDHVLHNIGASLESLGILEPEGGLIDPPVFDYRDHTAFPALVSPRRYTPMPALTHAVRQIGMGRSWPLKTTIYLVEYREWQPRFLRSPRYDDERYGLFAWEWLAGRDHFFLPMSRVPDSRPTGLSELVVLGRRSSLLQVLFDASPHREEEIIRLGPGQFTSLLRALLLDYETKHTERQREVAEQDQLGAMLWDFLSRDG